MSLHAKKAHHKVERLTAAQVRERMKWSPFIQLLQIRLNRMHRDGVTLECPVRKDLHNVIGGLHGGAAATLADTAAGFAIQRELGGGQPITTVEMKINYFRPVAEGKLRARARVIRLGSTLCVAMVDLSDAGGKSIGIAIVTYMRLPNPVRKSS